MQMTMDFDYDWQSKHELSKPEFLQEARRVALELLNERDAITVNDVRERCPVPPGMDGRVMGAVFKTPDFKATGEYVRSSRGTCHNRPIQLFTKSEA